TSEKSNQVSATITDVVMDGGIPTEYALSQNYPNPFNPSTAIKFEIPEAGNVKLLIYDSVGNEVAVLVNNYMSAGYYTFTWNAANYASGIYFYKMQTNTFSQVNKMLLIK
ncbi:MAG: T9SS type A sorting domain-containing protein, partial [Melioribacteraceae bacterium]|nr:T9SS type A sorting domain-containing protein [Melioribacteraceae bacterium]